MAKASSPRGRTGQKGERGDRGATGVRGPIGMRGPSGERGAKGERGERGPAGPPPRREDILALIDDQFSEIKQQLGIQLTRFGQLQAQLDQIHVLLKQIVKGPY